MNIALCSDLHLEHGTIELQNTQQAEVLILSGDICVARHIGADTDLGRCTEDFFTQVAREFPHVVYVLGNHEHYNGNLDYSADKISRHFEQLYLHNLHVLDNDSWEHQDVKFVGATLWTDMNNECANTMYLIDRLMSDFRAIRCGDDRLRPEDYVQEFRASLAYIDQETQDPNKTHVVVTHYCPSRQSIHEKYKSDHIMNGGFASDCDDFILQRPQIKLWTHGHTHEQFDYQIGSTRIVCNPRGYIGYEPQADTFQLKYMTV